MFDFGIGSTELLLIAVVAIIVVGPKDLPRLLRSIGQITTKMRQLAREFQGHLEEAARETGIDDIKSDIAKATDFSTDDLLKSDEELQKSFEEIAPKMEEAVTPNKPARAKSAKSKPASKAGAKSAAAKAKKAAKA